MGASHTRFVPEFVGPGPRAGRRIGGRPPLSPAIDGNCRGFRLCCYNAAMLVPASGLTAAPAR